MDQRTRTQLPLLPALLRAVEQQRKDAEELGSTPPVPPPAGDRFTAGGPGLPALPPGTVRPGLRHRAWPPARRRNLTHEEEAAFWSWATVEVLRHTGIRIEEMLELTHHSFIAYTLPTTGEVVPMLQVAPSKTDAERLLLVSPELAEVLTAIIFRVRGGQSRPAAGVAPTTCSSRPGARRCRSCSNGGTAPRTGRSPAATSGNASSRPRKTAQITVAGQPLRVATPRLPENLRHRRHPVRAAPAYRSQDLRSLQPLDTTMGYAAIYPEDVVSHHRAFIARRRAERPERGIPRSHRPGMGRIPGPFRAAESRPRDMRPRLRHPMCA